jgi:hypothetical protein
VRRHSTPSGVPPAALVLLCAVAFSLGTSTRQESPLPDRRAFIEQATKRLKSDERRVVPYTHREREVRIDFDGDGRPGKKAAKSYEFYPSVDGSPSYRRLVAVDDVPEPPSSLAEADRKHREKLRQWMRDRQSETPDDRARREREEQKARDQEARVIDEIPRVYDIQFVGRESIRGRPAILMTLNPRPGVRPAVEDAAPLAKAKGRAWVDETDFELVRAEFESTDTISVGLGFVARISKGAKVAFERQKVNDEVWLPARIELRPKARVALIKRIDADIVSEFSDYRKFTVEAAMEFALAKPGR